MKPILFLLALLLSCVSSKQTLLEELAKNKSISCFPPIVLINREYLSIPTVDSVSDDDIVERTVTLTDSSSSSNPFDSTNFLLNNDNEKVALDSWQQYPSLLSPDYKTDYIQLSPDSIIPYCEALSELFQKLHENKDSYFGILIPTDLNSFVEQSKDSICTMVYCVGRIKTHSQIIKEGVIRTAFFSGILTAITFPFGYWTFASVRDNRPYAFESNLVLIKKSSKKVLYYKNISTHENPCNTEAISTRMNQLFSEIGNKEIN